MGDFNSHCANSTLNYYFVFDGVGGGGRGVHCCVKNKTCKSQVQYIIKAVNFSSFLGAIMLMHTAFLCDEYLDPLNGTIQDHLQPV